MYLLRGKFNLAEVCTCKCIWDIVFDFNVDENSW